MTKIGTLLTIFAIYIIVSVTYVHFYNQSLDYKIGQVDVSNNTTIANTQTTDYGGGFTQTVVKYNPFSFFIDMFVFSVPDIPYFFSIIWWFLGFAAIIVAILILRGD